MKKSDFIASKIFKLYGCNCWNECPTTKSDDNLYLIGLDYHGHYEDDDCYFSYLNALTGEVVTDTWTTRFAAPAFSTYLRMMVPDAHKAGFIPDDIYNSYVDACWKHHLMQLVNDLTRIPKCLCEYTSRAMINRDLNIPVEITKGRKYRGHATLLRLFEESDGYWMQYNRGNHMMAKVLGEDNKIYIIKPEYIDSTDILTKIKNRLTNIVLNGVEDSNDLLNIYPFVEVDTTNAVDVRLQKHLEKYNAFRENHMPKLIDWCRSKRPEDTDEAIKTWAASIFARKYPIPEK